MSLSLKRAYAPPSATDGKRVLVERLWPRGMTKEAAAIDLWLKEVAPSTELRKWFGHEPAKWEEFQRRYRAELKDSPALAELRALAGRGRLTLVYASREERHNSASVLKRILEEGE